MRELIRYYGLCRAEMGRMEPGDASSSYARFARSPDNYATDSPRSQPNNAILRMDAVHPQLDT